MPRTVAELLARHAVGAPPRGSAGAAVSILLRAGAHEVETLLIERTQSESDPASGQVAFPGGHVDPADGNLLDTAYRELGEEVGLGRDDLSTELRFVSVQPARRFGLDVAVFAGELGARGRAPLAHSPAEVAHVFWLPASALERRSRVERETAVGLISVDATVHDGHVLWGFTRRVLRTFFDLPLEDEPAGPVFAPKRRPSEDSGAEPPAHI